VRIIHDGAAFELHGSGDAIRLRYRIDHPAGPHRFGAQMALALPCLFGRETLGARFRLTGVYFTHDAPATTDDYVRAFGAPVAFRQPHDEVVLPASLLAERLPLADPALCEHLDRHLDRMLASAPRESELLGRVRRAIGEDVRNGLPNIEDVARRMHMSARSLQRRLLAARTSFQKQLDQVRHELSMQYLEEDLALAEVAFLLGFSEPSNFHRAFKRWTGVTPAEARQRVRRGAAGAPGVA
jgi:AraC-like DNA-binding protein